MIQPGLKVLQFDVLNKIQMIGMKFKLLLLTGQWIFNDS